jgi:enoyl-CoA hydratase/carnithine racemase
MSAEGRHGSGTVTVEVVDRLAVLTIRRPEVHNALSAQVLADLRSALAAVQADEEVGVVAFTGAGDRAFVAGADIGEVRDYSLQTGLDAGIQQLFDEVEAFPKPTVAAVNGVALGGGCELAMACDIRIAAETARFGLPETALAVLPGAGGTQRLARLVGPARAKDLILSGRQVRADEALAIGLADRVVEPDVLHQEALAWAGTFASGAVVAQGLAKAAIDRGLDGSLPSGLDLEQQLFVDVFATDDAKIGVESFKQHGPGHATFTGR